MSFPTPTFVKWLTKHLADVTEGGMISRFELIHKIESEHAERLDIWRNDADSGHVPQELAQEIQDAAERDAQSRTSGQPQRYVVFAYRGTEAMHESQHAFLVKATFQPARFGDDSEPATEKGVISHYMRHDEKRPPAFDERGRRAARETRGRSGARAGLPREGGRAQLVDDREISDFARS